MGPQCEDGYTAIANELLEALCKIRIPGESTQVFLTILRKTYGYKKVVDQIALSQFVAATGMKKPNICRALKQLETLNVIKIDKIVGQNDNVKRVMYRINKHYDTWETEKRAQSRLKPLSKRTMTVIQNDNDSLSKTITSVIQNDTHKRKKENTKETPTKERLPLCEAWKSYVDMRVKIKKPMTVKAMKMAVDKLAELQSSGNDPVEVLNQSTFNSWQGLFEIKRQAQKYSGGASSNRTHGECPDPFKGCM